MKYTNEVIINAPLKTVTDLYNNEDNLSKWMKGLESIEHISGTKGEVGQKTKMVFQMGKRRIEMIETVKEVNFPERFLATYDANKVHNIILTKFSEIDENTTKYVTENEFQFKGFMKIIGKLMPSAFKKQSQAYLNDFKTFVESENN